MKNFYILLDGNPGLYQCGQTVTGRLMLDLEKEMQVNDVRIQLSGFAIVRWKEDKVTYYAKETYVDETISLTEYGQFNVHVTISAGQHEYPFIFQLPTTCPASFESQTGAVRYQLKGTVDYPWWINKHTERIFTVVSVLDLNSLGSAVTNPVQIEDMTQLCCWRCASDPIIAKFWIERTGYVPGETINFRMELDNRSSRKMNQSIVNLVMEVNYYVRKHRKSMRNILQEVKIGKVKERQSVLWNGNLTIPSVPPSYLTGCSIIDIKYCILLTVEPAGLALYLVLCNEVVIGTSPLASVMQQYGVQPLPTSLPLPAPDSRNLYAGNLISTNHPSIFYTESSLGQIGSNTTGDQQFAPLYGYYRWDNTDPTSHFTTSGV